MRTVTKAKPVKEPTRLRLTGKHARALHGAAVGSHAKFEVHGKVVSQSDGEYPGDEPSATVHVARVRPIRSKR